MILRHMPLPSIRALLLVAAAFLVAVVVAFDNRSPQSASADPAFGQVRPFPTSQVLIQGHIFPFNVRMTTCTDNAVVPSGDSTSATATTITDSTKNWAANEWVGYDIQLTSGTQSPQWRTVTSNTNNTITVGAAWGGVVDTGTTTSATTTTLVDAGSGWLGGEFTGYTLEMPSLGAGANRVITTNNADTLTVPQWPALVTDTATSGTSTTLQDTSVSWTANQWAGKAVQINSGGASVQSRRIVSNTNNTLTIEGTWTTAEGGSATSATSTTLSDATQAWTVNAFANMRIDMLTGVAAGDSRVITSNTATQITVPAWDGGQTPAFGDLYRVVQPPTNTSAYIIRDGPSIGTPFQIKNVGTPPNGTDFQLFKSACRPGGENVTVTYDDSKFDVVLLGGNATGGTSTTLVDSSANFKVNALAGSRVNITVGAGAGQSRTVVSNTKTQLTVTPAWSVVMPGAGSVYQVGGGQDGGFITSTGRTLSCPGGTIYGANTVNVDCVTLGSGGTNLPQGPTGIGNLVNVIFQANNRGIATFTISAQVLEVDGTVIPADVLNATRRVILCPDSAPPASPDGNINVADLGATAAAYGLHPGDPGYTPQKDPSEDGNINPADLGLIASVFGKKCNQP